MTTGSNSAPNLESQGQFVTDKNKDQLLKDLLNLVGRTSNIFLRTIFPDEVDQDNRRRPPTAGDKINASANDLVQTLMKCTPSYIRKIKPNENKSPTEYNIPNVLHQIKYLGLQENVPISGSNWQAGSRQTGGSWSG
jgi:myosin-1